MMRRQEGRQHLVDFTSAAVSAFDGTLADRQQAGQVALPRPVRPDDECDPLTEAQLELVEGQHTHGRQRRYTHAPSLGTRADAVGLADILSIDDDPGDCFGCLSVVPGRAVRVDLGWCLQSCDFFLFG